VKGLLVIGVILGGTVSATAQYALSPLPPLTPTACEAGLAPLAQFQALPAIADTGECVAADVVLLSGIALPDRTKVAVVPPATLRCTMAAQLVRWVREDVFPAMQVMAGSAIRRLDELGSFDCRTQNHIPGARTSEHGLANAFDVGGFRLADGRVLALTDVKTAKTWREVLRGSACARFTTVLGPGSDAYHEEHIHLDLAERHNGYRICQWEVREPVVEAKPLELQSKQAVAKIGEPVPLPRPRPISAAEPVKLKSKNAARGSVE